MWQSFEKYVKAGIWAVIAGLTWALLSPAVHDVGDAISTTIFPRLSSTSLCLALLGLLVVCLVLLGLLYEARSRSRMFRRYEPDPDFPGLLRHKRRHTEKVCPACLSDGRVTPVFITEGHSIIHCQKPGCHFQTDHPKHGNSHAPQISAIGV